jgi:uncharacterized DUF497 family protein
MFADFQSARAGASTHPLQWVVFEFEVASRVFDDPLHLSIQDRHEKGEERWFTVGLVDGIAVVAVAHTVREGDDETVIRLISARRATRAERERYEQGT